MSAAVRSMHTHLTLLWPTEHPSLMFPRALSVPVRFSPQHWRSTGPSGPISNRVFHVSGIMVRAECGAFVTISRGWCRGLLIAVTAGLIVFGGAAASLGGISPVRGAIRVLLGGWLAMALTAAVPLPPPAYTP